MRAYRNFKTFCFDCLAATRDLIEAIENYNRCVSELHADIKKIEGAVGYLHRAERHQREAHGHKIDV
jgi:hypothetical protein